MHAFITIFRHNIAYGSKKYSLHTTYAFRTDVQGTNPVRTQPMNIDQPWMYDFTGYALTSGT